MKKSICNPAALAIAVGLSLGTAHAETCTELAAAGLTDASLKGALRSVVSPAGTPNGGLGGPMWLTLVDGSGMVCAVTNSLDGSAHNADATADIWLGSRVISAQKANTANAFSTGRLALSTANLYSAVQPGGSLYGLQASNPVDATAAYAGRAADFGTTKDPLVGHRIGGINVFGGGLALYRNGKKIGAIGVSGDTSCTDHVVAWKVRAITWGWPRAAIRPTISVAALSVKVTSRILFAGTTPVLIAYAARRLMTRVLPVPAPARMTRGPVLAWTASRWASLRSSSNSPSGRATTTGRRDLGTDVL